MLGSMSFSNPLGGGRRRCAGLCVGSRYLRIDVNDDASQALGPYFQEAHEFIEEARLGGTHVLVR